MRVAARLAILRFFIFRAHLQEERCVEPVVRCRPSPPPVSFGTGRFRGVEFPHRGRTLQISDPGETPLASAGV